LPCKYVIGAGRELRRAVAAWRALDANLDVRAVEIPERADAAAMRAVVDALDRQEATAFVALDPRHLNFPRLELARVVAACGLSAPALVEGGAIVAAGVQLPDNAWIGAGAILQPECTVGANVVIGPGAIVGHGAVLGESAYVEAGVVIGHGAGIGVQATIGLGVTIGHGVQVGALCVIDRPGRIEADVAASTFIQTSHAHPIRIVGQ